MNKLYLWRGFPFLLLASAIAVAVSPRAVAGPTDYPFHPQKVVSVQPGTFNHAANTWAPTPYNKTVATQYASRVAGRPIYALRYVNWNAAAIRAASIARMATPAGLALQTAMLARELYWSPSGENDWAYEPVEYPPVQVNCLPQYAEFFPSPGSVTLEHCVEHVVAKLESTDFDGPISFQDHPTGTDVWFIRARNGSGSTVGVMQMSGFQLDQIMNGDDIPDPNKSGSPTDEEVFDALDSVYNDNSSTTNNFSWTNFFTDIFTGGPISNPSNFYDNSVDVNINYDTWVTNNPGSTGVPAPSGEGAYQQDTPPTPPPVEQDQEQPTEGGEPCTGEAVGTLGCVNVGTELSPVPLTEQAVPFDFTPVAFSGGSGSCPADITMNTTKGTLTLSYQPTCDVLVMLKPFLILVSTFMAGFIVIGRSS